MGYPSDGSRRRAKLLLHALLNGRSVDLRLLLFLAEGQLDNLVLLVVLVDWDSGLLLARGGFLAVGDLRWRRANVATPNPI